MTPAQYSLPSFSKAFLAALKDENDQVKAQAAWALGLKGDHRAVEALGAAMKDQNQEVRKKATWALGMILMRDGKAADKAADLDIDLKKREDRDDNDDKKMDDDEVGGLRVPVGLSVPIPISVPMPIPIPSVNVVVSPRVVVAPGSDLPSRTKSKEKDKSEGD